ncbi:MAG: class I SAM-dependent methyltransferase [Candidatus Thorarchaeota archaeon]
MNKKYPTVLPDKYMSGWDNLYKKQLEQPLNELPTFLTHYALQEFYLFTYGQDVQGKNAIDLATGDGMDACFLAKLGYNVTTFDILPSSVEITKKRAEALGISERMNVFLDDMENFELKAESYDVVSAIQCLQYLLEKAPAKLEELIRSVKPGGWLLYGGNVKPHFKTEPPLRFITMLELRKALENWIIFSLAREERLMRPGDKRGYVWVVAQKPEEE